ncbi:uncharacterized protein LOC114543675 [Dendronephthya gigantea]|uniref:uncharacterized protein LOC114543675 n=1 Tax=Dendronephthya gigantea TaxID=151771 RepID=UPI00106B2EFE|nr:uncharacterized protein LOC114543675 [Dendronephthya gigantea]
MATVESECFEVLNCLLKAVQANEDSSSFENSCTDPLRIPSGKSEESKELRKKWINLISRRDFSPTIGHRICSLHFPGGRKTYLNNLPTIVPKATRPTPTKPRSTTFSELDDNNNSSRSIEEPDKMATPVNENIDPIACLQEQTEKLLATNEKLKEENGRLKNENKCQKDEIRGLTEQLEQERKRIRFSIECFKDNDILIRFYTGLEDYKTFKTLFDSFGPAVNNLVYYGTKTDLERLSSEDVIKRGPKRTNSPEQEFFLVLARLRLGLLEEDIATRAGLSQSHMLRSFPIWPSRKAVDNSMPASFRDMYPSTRVIIDCTEIFIEKPNSFRSQSATFSTYKSHNTAKGLVGISPSGAVTFVSDLYAGRSSDQQITIDCGILNLVENGDSIMADRGFDIEHNLPDGVSLNIPPFMREKEHLSIEEETKTRRIASVRIHVERAIARIKNLKF